MRDPSISQKPIATLRKVLHVPTALERVGDRSEPRSQPGADLRSLQDIPGDSGALHRRSDEEGLRLILAEAIYPTLEITDARDLAVRIGYGKGRAMLAHLLDRAAAGALPNIVKTELDIMKGPSMHLARG